MDLTKILGDITKTLSPEMFKNTDMGIMFFSHQGRKKIDDVIPTLKTQNTTQLLTQKSEYSIRPLQRKVFFRKM